MLKEEEVGGGAGGGKKLKSVVVNIFIAFCLCLIAFLPKAPAMEAILTYCD